MLCFEEINSINRVLKNKLPWSGFEDLYSIDRILMNKLPWSCFEDLYSIGRVLMIYTHLATVSYVYTPFSNTLCSQFISRCVKYLGV